MLPNISSILSTVRDLGQLLDLAKHKLLGSPEEASVKLAEALNELCGILEFVEQEVVGYLALHFLDDHSNYIASRKTLLSLESGYVTVKGYKAKGHCHKIKVIYRDHLARWFTKVLDPQEAQQIQWLFERMDTADDDMVRGIGEITGWLSHEASFALNLLDGGNLMVVNTHIQQARLTVQPMRREVVTALAELRLLEASLMASAKGA